jgi:hypothetical protein
MKMFRIFASPAVEWGMLHQVVEVFYDTSPITTTRVVRGGSLIEGTKNLDAQAG